MSDKAKPINPYERLRREFAKFADKVSYPNKRLMFNLSAAKLREGFRLDDVAERVAAAATLGYDVVLERSDNGDLRILYRQKMPERPWNV